MMPILSHNTQAILLLTAPLITGRGNASADLLSPGEYKRLARHLREIQRQPADLVSPDAGNLLQACQHVIDQARLQRLLGRGFLLSQAIERWQTRAIWVVSRADSDYPQRLKARLREDAPAVIYGCGNIDLLETGGLAVVGSRHVNYSLIDYTMTVGRLAARAGRTLISGGAKGIDQAAMQGAIEAGGKVCGVMSDSLEKTTMNREHRNLLLDGQLTLISPYDPSAGFNVGNAMQRNKLIYALADASLVVSSDLNKGGTWAGAIEQLNKYRFVPVYVRSTGESNSGLVALRRKGAMPWPNPKDARALESVFAAVPPRSDSTLLFPGDSPDRMTPLPPVIEAITEESPPTISAPLDKPSDPASHSTPSTEQANSAISDLRNPMVEATSPTPADTLLATVREVIQQLLIDPMKETDVAAELHVSNAQAKAWLKYLTEEGVIEKQKNPAGYVVKKSALFK